MATEHGYYDVPREID
ncbi:hypothetical protein [Haladaptatus halobius]